MSHDGAAKPKPAVSERRSGKDRRKEDQGPPPGKGERRRSLEPRTPDVEEVDLTQSQWGDLFTPKS